MLEPPPYHSIENEEFLHSFYSFCTFVALINGKKLNYATVFLKLLESESLLNLFKLYINEDNNFSALQKFIQTEPSITKSKYITKFLNKFDKNSFKQRSLL